MKCGEFEILRFQSRQEYEEWLSWRSPHVKAKASKFEKLFGKDVIPIVLVLDTDTYGEGGGTHIFLHPAFAEQILSYAVFEAEEC